MAQLPTDVDGVRDSIMTYVSCHDPRGRAIPSSTAYRERNSVLCQGKCGLCRGAEVGREI